jgi:hypothetical protein
MAKQSVNGRTLNLLSGMTVFDEGMFEVIKYRDETICTSEKRNLFFVGEEMEEFTSLIQCKKYIDGKTQ